MKEPEWEKKDRFNNLKLLKPSIAFLENPFVINVVK